MLRRTALSLAILAIWPSSAALAAADSNTAGNHDSYSELSILAFAILFLCLARLVVPEKQTR